jgi:alanine racemase
MDQITVDMTHIPDASVGDEAVLIGQSEDMVQTAEDVADQARTISYEVLTGLLPRVPRVYVREGRPVAVTRLGRLTPVPQAA